ncbi:MAG TPA: choice-of-anchor K domain-containing protein [Kofleriaceae bacterium]
MGACSQPFGSVEQQVADPAPTLTITAAAFHTVDGTSPTFCGQAGYPACLAPPPTQVRWGISASTTTERSGLGFAAGAAHTVVYGESFAIGTLTHFNFPTNSGTSASQASLDLHLRVDPSIAGPALFDSTITIPFAIDETPNAAPCVYPSATPCADKITFGTSTFALDSTSSYTVYALQILGFVDPNMPTPVSGLISEENGNSSAVLQAVVTEHCLDADADGVCDEFDECLGTPEGEQTDSDGCTLSQICPCEGPWNNHGEYVSCVAHETQDMVSQGLMTPQQRSLLVSTAGQSTCGKPQASIH